MPSNDSSTEPRSPLHNMSTFMHNMISLAKKSLNIIEKIMDPNIIDYYIINYAIPSIITIENHYQIDFGKPVPIPHSEHTHANQMRYANFASACNFSVKKYPLGFTVYRRNQYG